MGPGGAVPALIELRDQGVIGAIGIASGTLSQVREYVDTGAFDVVLSHNRYTLVTRTAEPLFEAARAHGMTVFNAAPFGGGDADVPEEFFDAVESLGAPPPGVDD